MGFIGSLLGGSAGNPQSSALSDPNQIQQQLTQTQGVLGQYGPLLQALQAQNGLQNQSNLYNQYGQIAQGQGPNPAQAMLAQQTGANTANQAALMAGQRGVASNPALASRQIAQMGAQNQQNAVGQGATLQAQQQLAALGQQSGLANQMVGQQLQGLGQANQANQGLLGIQQGALQAQNTAAQQAAQNNSKTGLGVVSGLGQAVGTLAGFSQGGDVQEPKEMHILDFLQMDPSTSAQQPMSGMNMGGYMSSGNFVPGQASMKGDNKKNDTVPAMLSPGEIVVPRSAAKDPKKAATFAAAVAARHRKATHK